MKRTTIVVMMLVLVLVLMAQAPAGAQPQQEVSTYWLGTLSESGEARLAHLPEPRQELAWSEVDAFMQEHGNDCVHAFNRHGADQGNMLLRELIPGEGDPIPFTYGAIWVMWPDEQQNLCWEVYLPFVQR